MVKIEKGKKSNKKDPRSDIQKPEFINKNEMSDLKFHDFSPLGRERRGNKKGLNDNKY